MCVRGLSLTMMRELLGVLAHEIYLAQKERSACGLARGTRQPARNFSGFQATVPHPLMTCGSDRPRKKILAINCVCISPLFIAIYKIVAYFFLNDVSRFQRTIHQVSRVIFITEDTFLVNEHAVCLLWSFWHVIASGRTDILKVYLPASAGTTTELSHI